MHALKVVKSLLQKGETSHECIMMVDETYLQKDSQYQRGEFIGGKQGRRFISRNNNCYDIVGLKESNPFVIQVMHTEVPFSAKWLSKKTEEHIN